MKICFYFSDRKKPAKWSGISFRPPIIPSCMKMPIIAVLKLSTMNPSEKVTKADYMAQQWVLNEKHFPDTAPNTAEERARVTLRLSVAQAAALDGSKQTRAEEKAASAEFDRYFSAFRDWANQPDVALGDEIRIGQLGLDVSRQEARRAEKVGTPDLQPITGTTEGELTVNCLPMLDAKAYVFFVAYGEEMPADDAYRYCIASTKAKVVLTLTQGHMAWVRVLAVGAKGPSPLSGPQKRRVL